MAMEREPRVNQRLKIVLRRLPADLPAPVFWQSVSPWVVRENEEILEGAQLGSSERVMWSTYQAGQVRRRWVLYRSRRQRRALLIKYNPLVVQRQEQG